MKCNKKFILFSRYVGGTDYTPTTIGDNVIDLSDSNQIDVIQGTIKRVLLNIMNMKKNEMLKQLVAHYFIHVYR